MAAKTLMVVGSMSSAGKSLFVTALCRIYRRRGLRVAPFKAQNMSNNAAVCPDGCEIGRAQALQALAAGLLPNVDMNPVLIKPEADSHSQVILMGRPWATLSARNYYERKAMLWDHVTASLNRLRDDFDLVIIEGAGSPVELNLKSGDIVNMAIARFAQAPTLLVGDIDRGGIFAQMLGTLWLLDEDDRKLVRGLVINKFRGDLSLFNDGIDLMEQKGKIPVLGVIPYLRKLNLPDEDAVSLEDAGSAEESGTGSQIDIAVLVLPRIANFDDFDSLKSEMGVRIRYISSVAELGFPQAVIIPGTKSTLADLEWMRATGLADAILQYALNGGNVVGICGGYQIIGEKIEDPLQVESSRIESTGLGLLAITTRFLSEKATFLSKATIQSNRGWLGSLNGEEVSGYEIHMGETIGKSSWLVINEHNGIPVETSDGSVSENGKIWGCYLHGIFNNDHFRHTWLKSLGWSGSDPIPQKISLQKSLDLLADTVESSLNMDLLDQIIWRETGQL